MKGVDFWWIYMSFLQRQITHWTKSDCYGWMIVMPDKSFVIAILAIGGSLVMHLCRTKASERDLDYHLIDECGHKRCLHHRSITIDEKAGALQPIRCTTWRPDPTNLRTRWAIPHLLRLLTHYCFYDVIFICAYSVSGSIPSIYRDFLCWV